MTVEEYVTFGLGLLDEVKTALDTALPNECKIDTRYMLSGISSEEQWIAALRDSSLMVRRLFVLWADLAIGNLANTAGARNFHPTWRFNLELYHDYSDGTNADNSERNFISDALRIQYAVGKNRILGTPKKAVVQRYSMRLGIRPSKVQALHMGRGEMVIDLTDVRYE